MTRPEQIEALADFAWGAFGHVDVSHAYNIERIEARHDEIVKAYATYAPRYEGDDEFDVRSLMERTHEAVDNAYVDP